MPTPLSNAAARLGLDLRVEDLRRMLPHPHVRRLDNGLTVCIAAGDRAPVVASALFYRAGARDDPAGNGGSAHFLEHMMFKGSARYGAGEIDRLTRALGGVNNATTSHDTTLYYFTFAADRWRRALDVEADRMAGLTLDPAEVDSERQVILEEIAMYEGEPWEALNRRVAAAFFGRHPYARPVLGTPPELEATGADELRAFHRRRYRPGNAVLVLAGQLGDGALDAVEERFGALEDRPAAEPLPAPAPPSAGELVRLERRQGEVARMMLALPGPADGDPDQPLVQLLMAVLGSGRSSRLHRALVDEGQLCVWVAADAQETVDPSPAIVALEVVPGVEPARVADEVLRQIERLRRDGPSPEELARARRILTADWVFGHDRVFQQALMLGSALIHHDLEHPWRVIERLLGAGIDELRAAAERYLRPAGGVLGWSLPREAA